MAAAALLSVMSGSNVVIPVSGATFFTPEVSPLEANSYSHWQFYIEFFSDAAGTIPATPSAGTIDVAATPLGNNYLTASNVQTIQATACGTPTSTYTPPAAEGALRRGRITFTGVTGAAYCRATFWRY